MGSRVIKGSGSLLFVVMLFYMMSITGCSDDNAAGGTPYTLAYFGNGGTPVPGNVGFTNGQPLVINDGSTIVFPGYLFSGWTNASGNIISGSITGGSSDINLYASWIRLYTLSYNGNGGTPIPAATSCTNGQTVPVNNGSSISNYGYVFTGWTNASGASVSGSIVMGESNVVLYAGWMAVPHSVTYVGNGAVSVPVDPGMYLIGQNVTIAAADTVTNTDDSLAFAGWTNSAGQIISGTISMIGEDLVLYASWIPRFEDNGDGTITDHANNLMWRKNCRVTGSAGSYFQEMINYCDTNTFGGYTNWRLPEIYEYQTIIDRDFSPIQINTGIFTNVSTSRYMSISMWKGNVDIRWYVAFYPTSGETLNTNAMYTNSRWFFIPVRSIP